MSVKHVVRIQLEVRTTVNVEGDENLDAVAAVERAMRNDPQLLRAVFGPLLDAASKELGIDVSDHGSVTYRILDSYPAGMHEFPVAMELPLEYEPRKKAT